MTRGGLETDGALIEMAVYVDVTKLSTLKAGLVIARVVTSKGYIMITAGPQDFSADEGNFFFRH